MQNAEVINTINEDRFDDWDFYKEGNHILGFTVDIGELTYNILFDGSVRDTDYEYVGQLEDSTLSIFNELADRRLGNE